MNVRHVVVVRKDLQMSPGLLAAQVAHISDQFLRQRALESAKFSALEKEWCKEPYITVLAVNTKEELQEVAKRASDARLSVKEWNDTLVMPTLALPLRVFVGISIGPDDSDKLKAVTNDLPLL